MSKGRWKTTVWMIGVSIFILGGCQMKDKVFKEFEIQVNEEQFYQNPLEINQIGDPFVLKSSDGNYYCYPTSDARRGYKVWVSQDMVHWEKQAENIYIKERDGWAISDFWAPEVYEWDGMYYMYYTARWKEGNSLRIGVATSESPLGPFKDVSNKPMFDFGYAVIDANVLIDDDGQGYLYYSRDCSENQLGGYNESHLYEIQLSDDKLEVIGEPVLLEKPEQPWELETGNYRWNEGAFVFKRENIYYMMYSANFYGGRQYSLGYATSDSPLGKYTKYENNPILYTQSDWEDISGPGHHSITRSPNGKVWYAMYHTHSIPALGGGDRQVNMDVMGFREDGSIYMNGPTISPQLIPSKMGEAYEIMANTQITKNGEPAEVLKDGEFALYTEGLVKTEVISLVGKDIVEVTFDINQEIQGILLYTGVADDEKLEGVTIKFSNGYGISNLKFPDGVGQPAVAQFEPMEVKWIKIYNGDLESSKGVLSLVSVIPC